MVSLRTIKVHDNTREDKLSAHEKAAQGDPKSVGAPMPAAISEIRVSEGDAVEAGELLVTLEAMKMEVKVSAETAGVVKRIPLPVGAQVDAKDLLVELA